MALWEITALATLYHSRSLVVNTGILRNALMETLWEISKNKEYKSAEHVSHSVSSCFTWPNKEEKTTKNTAVNFLKGTGTRY
jgi:hypothetical protein